MNFELSQDQAMLKDTAERLFAEATGDLWPLLAEAGLLAAPFAEADGGLALGGVEQMIIGEAAGQADSLSPYGAAVSAAGTALRLASEAPSGLIGDLAAGERRFAWAHEEAGLSVAAPRATQVQAAGEGWTVLGAKSGVVDAADDGLVVLTATLDGAPAVVVAQASGAGVTRREHALFDGSQACDLAFDAAPVERVLAVGDEAVILIERVGEHAAAWRSAEAVGLMQAMLDATVEHLKTRRQFGEPLSAFQALRHKASEMLVALEQARSMAMYAALCIDDADAAVRRTALSQVRSVVGRSSRFVAQTAVQLHGGIGVTEEHPVGRAFRRLTLIDLEMERG